jgi:hypothetical protein
MIDGTPLVYDREIQLEDCPHIFLWNHSTRSIGKYVATVTRSVIRPCTDSAVAASAIASYLEWKALGSREWLEEQAAHYQTRRIGEEAEATAKARQARELAMRHEEHMTERGLSYKGVRTSTRQRRVANCWSCHSALSSTTDLECNACSWILCSCGACGCGRYM